MFDIPPELKTKPLPLIGLSGLDVTNPIHRSIWDAFSNNRRSDVTNVQYKLLTPSYEFLTVKPKRNSYEWYIPKGILKRNWMNKYLNDIPSVVAVFYELDWNDSLWNEKRIECASRIQSLRTGLEGRSTKIVIVLIQKNIQQSVGSDDMVALEKATALCSACDLHQKLLYHLPYGDHFMGYISRLESAFYDLAQSFYHHEYRIIKGHRDQLNKTVHQYLFVRHQFKMGFLNELKQDQHLPQKHYLQAYNHLIDIRIADTNVMEIKTVANFINYKLCKIMFNLSLPKDAIAQFRLHIERFKNRTGPQELLFEHHAWMTSQYSIFAELFDDAIRLGLPAVQTQHPGYYFQIASHHAELRQSACQELCKNINSYPQPDPLAGEGKLEFYGQRQWRSGKVNTEPVDTMKESMAIQALKYKEKTSVNHSMIIIGLLGNAMSQFKIYRCPRMRRSLVVAMAEEYYKSKDYGKVLTLLMHMLWEYHAERWPLLLADILKSALRAAYLSTSIQDYLALAVEALSSSTEFPKDRQIEIYSNIKNILQKRPPNPEPEIPEDMKFIAIEKWITELNRSEPLVFTIDDNNLTSFMGVKAHFTQPRYQVNSMITVQVLVRNSYFENVEFSKISITMNSPIGNLEYIVTDSQTIFHSKETKTFQCEFPTPQQSEGNEIRITMVSLCLGNESNCCIILRFSSIDREISILDRYYPEIQQLRTSEFDRMRPSISAEIRPEESSLSIVVDSPSPALLGEWLPITLILSTSENIASVSLNMTLITDNNNEHSTELSLTMLNNKQTSILVGIDHLAANCVHKQVVYFKAQKIGDRNIIIKVEYSRSDKTKGSKELIYFLPVVEPFNISTQFYTTLFEPVTSSPFQTFINQSFIIVPSIFCTSVWPIEIVSTFVELVDSVHLANEQENCILKGTVLREGETGSDTYCLTPKSSNKHALSIGIYTIKWKRANDNNSVETSSSVTLPAIWVENIPIALEAKLPAHGWVRTPFCVTYLIRNHSDYMITLHLTMGASDAFLFAGQKQINIYVLPKNERKIEWILRPLVTGLVQLPTLNCSVPPDEEYKLDKAQLVEVLKNSLPSHIYILPKSQCIKE